MRVDKSLSTCVCFVLWPGKCNRASLCSSCFSVASATTSVLVALKVWLCRLTGDVGRRMAILQGAPSAGERGYRCSGPVASISLLFKGMIFQSVRLQLLNIPPSVDHQRSQNEIIKTTFLSKGIF